jgi:DHA2 family multidrug resistance protein
MLSMIPVSILALGTLPPDRVKNASGLFNLMRNLGGAVGLAVITTQLNHRWDLHFERLREAINWSRDTVTERFAGIAQGFSATLGNEADTAALRQVSNMVKRDALVMAFSDVFLMIAVVFGVTLLLVPLARRPRPVAAGAGGH